MARHPGLLATAALLLLLPTGCARQDISDPVPLGSGGIPALDGAEPSGTAAPALRVSSIGGHVSASDRATRLPEVSVYPDGRVITPAIDLLMYPGPALPGLAVRRISRAEVERLTAQAAAAGVGSATDLGQTTATDAVTTRFTLNTGAGQVRLDVYDLGRSQPAAGASGLTPEQLATRARLRALHDDLLDLQSVPQGAPVGPAETYRPAALAVFAEPRTGEPATPDPLTPPPDRTWPGPPLVTAAAGGSLLDTCLTVDGAAATAVLAAAAKAGSTTAWLSQGRRWTLYLRPLLPDEAGCQALRSELE